MLLIAIPDFGDPGSALGILLVTLACFCYGFAPNIARPLQIKYGSLPVILRAQMVALAITLPFGFDDVLRGQWS